MVRVTTVHDTKREVVVMTVDLSSRPDQCAVSYRRGRDRFAEVEAELLGGRWTPGEAEALIRLIREGEMSRDPPVNRP